LPPPGLLDMAPRRSVLVFLVLCAVVCDARHIGVFSLTVGAQASGVMALFAAGAPLMPDARGNGPASMLEYSESTTASASQEYRWALWHFASIPLARWRCDVPSRGDAFPPMPRILGSRPVTVLKLFNDGNLRSNPWHQDDGDQPRRPRRIIEASARNPRGESSSVLLPDTWAHVFHGSDSEGPALNLTVSHNGLQLSRASLACDPGFKVEVEARKHLNAHNRRDLFVSRRLAMLSRCPGAGPISGVVPVLETVHSDDWTFLMRGIGDGTLEEICYEEVASLAGHFDRAGLDDNPADGMTGAFADERVLVPLFIDLLRGLVTLHRAGVVHASLDTGSITVKDGRAYVNDLSYACVLHDGDGFGCSTMRDGSGQFVGSAYMHAPERVGGITTGPENDVWSLGLIFAELCLGYPPTMRYGPDRSTANQEAQGREEIRSAIRDSFHIRHADGYDGIPRGIQTLLECMLQKDRAARCTAGVALSLVLQLAEDSGIPVPADQGPLLLPDGWSRGG